MSQVVFDLVIGSRPFYITGKDCGYCHGKKDPMESGYSLPSYRQKYLDSQSKHHNEHNTTTGDPDSDSDSNSFSEYPNSTSMGCIIHSFSPECYERLMNKGFRRSGTYLYKPDQLRNCCRMYAIRTNLGLLKPNKEHRHTVNRFVKSISTDGLQGQQQSTSSNVNAGGVTKTQRPKKIKGSPFNLKETLLKVETTVPHDKFHTIIEPAEATQEKYELYKKYQIQVHNDKPDEVSYKGFKRFLCDSPFVKSSITKNDWERINEGWRAGEFKNSGITGPIHECYYLDSKLIAFAVLDLLPESISSVYFIWDPDHASLGLGTLSALREIVLTEMLGKKYYYLGYYIDDCHKMKYKAKFGGEILDSCSMKFVKLDSIKSLAKDGGLMVFKERSEEDEEDKFSVKLNELEIPETYSTLDHQTSEKLINIGEDIYGLHGGAFEKADRIIKKLVKSINGLEDLASQNDDILWTSASHRMQCGIPKVSPGLLPLWQINELNETNELKQVFSHFFLYDMNAPGVYRFDPEEDLEQVESIINLIRLFGLEQCKRNILYC